MAFECIVNQAFRKIKILYPLLRGSSEKFIKRMEKKLLTA